MNAASLPSQLPLRAASYRFLVKRLNFVVPSIFSNYFLKKDLVV
jgi:hypothetical protein